MTPTEEIITLTQELIKFRTTQDNKQEIRKCTNFIKKYFANTQLTVEELEHNNVLSLYIYNNEQKHHLLLNGHYDVVEAEEEQFQPVLKDNKLYGRGSLDMKTGIATIMYLLKHNQNKNVAALLTSDEEVGGHNGIAEAIKQIDADLVIAAEQNNNENPQNISIVDGGKGILQVKIISKGKAAHGAYPWKGINAADKLIESYQQIKQLFQTVTENNPWHTSMNLGIIKAGSIINQVPEYAEATLDIRYTEETNPKELINKIKQITEVEILQQGPMTYNEPDNEHINNLKKIAEEVTKKEVTFKKIMGGSDIRYTTQQHIPSVLMGPWGENMHAQEEYVLLDSITPFYEIIQNYIKKYC